MDILEVYCVHQDTYLKHPNDPYLRSWGSSRSTALSALETTLPRRERLHPGGVGVGVNRALQC